MVTGPRTRPKWLLTGPFRKKKHLYPGEGCSNLHELYSTRPLRQHPTFTVTISKLANLPASSLAAVASLGILALLIYGAVKPKRFLAGNPKEQITSTRQQARVLISYFELDTPHPHERTRKRRVQARIARAGRRRRSPRRPRAHGTSRPHL